MKKAVLVTKAVSMRVQEHDLEAALCADDQISALVELLVATETKVLADKAQTAKATWLFDNRSG